MSVHEVRAGNSQSRQNESAFALVMFEVLMVALAIGVFNSSWIWGGTAFIGTFCLMSTPHASKALPPLAAIAWGYIGYAIGDYFGSTGAAAVVGLLFAGMSYGLHLQAIEHIQDFNGEDSDKNVSEPDGSQPHADVPKRVGGPSEETTLREVFTKDASQTVSTDRNTGRYTSISVFVLGLFAMLFWWWYEPDPTRGFDASSKQTWSRLNEADRKIYQKLPSELRSHVNGLDESNQPWYLQEWDQRRQETCPFGRAREERFDEYYGLQRCLSKDERDLIDFALDHIP